MVVLWSSHSVESDWVKEEAEEARALKKLVPVLIEPMNAPVGGLVFAFACCEGTDFSYLIQ
jgi:hypothetical protein